MKLIVALFIAFTSLPHAVLAEDNTIINDTPEFITKPANLALINQLRYGGYVIYMRHGNTDASRPDQVPKVDLGDCATQRPLTKEGRLLSAKIGQRIRRAKIPIGEVFSSPMCRTRETALAAFGPQFVIVNTLMFTSNMTAKDKIPVIEATRELISKPVEGKVNRVIVSHAQSLMEIIGYLPKPEGTVVIFKPLGNKNFKYIATIAPTQWNSLIYRAPITP
jgi:phosphohistidine phosphatase SixA